MVGNKEMDPNVQHLLGLRDDELSPSEDEDSMDGGYELLSDHRTLLAFQYALVAFLHEPSIQQPARSGTVAVSETMHEVLPLFTDKLTVSTARIKAKEDTA
ncbi:MAG: hypothetical protein M2R45_05452 [Verrucomicrobia subdivision 3 bacterium]|nr:hypothetical protein [Limisphaerales bacterium]